MLEKKRYFLFAIILLAATLSIFALPLIRANDYEIHEEDVSLLGDLIDKNFIKINVFYWKTFGHYTLPGYNWWRKHYTEQSDRLDNLLNHNLLKDNDFILTPAKAATRTRKSETSDKTHIDYSIVHLPTLNSELKFPAGSVASPRQSLVGFWARSKTPQTIRVSYKLTSAKPDNQVWQSLAKLDSEWQFYSGLTEVAESKPGEYSVAFSALAPQSTFDIRDGVYFVPMDKPEPVAKKFEYEIDHLIEFVRKDKLRIHVLDQSDRPVRSARVKIEQLQHEFIFGCGVDFAPGKSPHQQDCQNKFTALFNCAALPASWNIVEPTPKKLDFAHIDAALAWALKQNLRTMLLDVLSPYTFPDWAPKDPVMVRYLIKEHVALLINHFGDTVSIWNICDGLDGAMIDSSRNGFCTWVASNDPRQKAAYALRQILRWAHFTVDKSQPVFLCSGDDVDKLSPILTDTEKITSVFNTDGYGVRYTNEIGSYKQIQRVYEDMKPLGKLGKPIYITNLGIASSALSGVALSKNGPDKIGEKKQAEYALSIYRFLFSRPSVSGIIWSNFIDENSAAATPMGVMRADGSIKPVYNGLLELIHKKWWTQVEVQTDNNGDVTQNVFFGDYQITVLDNQNKPVIKKVQFYKGKSARSIVTIKL